MLCEEVNLDQLIKELESVFRPLFDKNQNTFEIIIQTDKKVIQSDAMRLKQSLSHLLDNANKFTQKGKITLEVTSLGTVLQFAVTDTGIGISSEQQHKIFQRFSQGDASITRKYGGTGVGLYLAKSFSELLGGSISVKSQKDKGTTFVIALPQKNITAPVNSEKFDQFQGKTALVISYDPSTVNDVLRDVQQMGFQVTHARNGQEGLKKARDRTPELIILDVAVSLTMGDAVMDQWITLSELKSDDRLSRIPLVVLTKDMSQENLGFVLGEVDFLTKPIDRHSMIHKIKLLVPEGIPTILVVDDDESARDIMSAAAKKVGWTSITAVNGHDALEKMAKTLPSIILLDLMMPEMDGFTMIGKLQENEAWRHIPVVIVSAKELSADERSLLKKYSRGILQKGAYSRQALVDAICDQVK
jgi:CheY-like chemotaxis protein/anti-sigma regulatory factor (Ser/Thr protein kinase)